MMEKTVLGHLGQNPSQGRAAVQDLLQSSLEAPQGWRLSRPSEQGVPQFYHYHSDKFSLCVSEISLGSVCVCCLLYSHCKSQEESTFVFPIVSH